VPSSCCGVESPDADGLVYVACRAFWPSQESGNGERERMTVHQRQPNTAPTFTWITNHPLGGGTWPGDAGIDASLARSSSFISFFLAAVI
jgi:hypothetical protein